MSANPAIFQKGTKASKTARWCAWIAVLATALWISNAINAPIRVHTIELPPDKGLIRPSEIPEYEAAMLSLKTDIQKIWVAETSEIDALNREAKQVAAERNLSPGDPLPPKTFYSDQDELRSGLLKDEAAQILRTYTLTRKGWKTRVWVTIHVGDKAPDAQTPYAAMALTGDAALIKGAMMLHPKTKGSLKKILQAEAKIAEGLEKSGKTADGAPKSSEE